MWIETQQGIQIKYTKAIESVVKKFLWDNYPGTEILKIVRKGKVIDEIMLQDMFNKNDDCESVFKEFNKSGYKK